MQKISKREKREFWFGIDIHPNQHTSSGQRVYRRKARKARQEQRCFMRYLELIQPAFNARAQYNYKDYKDTEKDKYYQDCAEDILKGLVKVKPYLKKLHSISRRRDSPDDRSGLETYGYCGWQSRLYWLFDRWASGQFRIRWILDLIDLRLAGRL